MREIENNISEELGIRRPIVQAIIRSQFDFVRDVMEDGQFRAVHLPYFGKFCVKPNRLEYLEKARARRGKTKQDTENQGGLEEDLNQGREDGTDVTN